MRRRRVIIIPGCWIQGIEFSAILAATRVSSEVVASLLHDVVDDSNLSHQFLQDSLGDDIVDLVLGWVVKGALDVDSLIGANPCIEGGEDEGADDQATKEQLTYDKKGFMAYIKKYLKTLTLLVPEERQATFKKDVEGAVKFLLSKLSNFQFFVGENMKDDSSTIFAYYKECKTDPTFLYLLML